MSDRKIYKDKNGKRIKAGMWLYNKYDRDKYHKVLEENGELFLGDFDSPLWRYAPQDFWEIKNPTSR